MVRSVVVNSIKYVIATLFIYVVVLLILLKVKINGIPLVYRTSDYLFYKGGNTYSKFQEYNIENQYDVIVLGSSHAYRGYDPRIFKKAGYTMFNLGSSGQSIFNTYFIAKDYVKKPKLIILDVYEGAFDKDGFESSADLIQNISNDQTALQIGIGLKDVRAVNMLALRMANKNTPPMYVDSTYVSGGFNETNDSIGTSPTKDKPGEIKILDKQWSYFIKTLDYLNDCSIPVVAVNHPSPNNVNRHNHEIFAQKISKILNKYGIVFMDYAYKLNINPSYHFYDNTHLNQAGVTIFNQVLLEDLKKSKLLVLKNAE